MSFSVSSGLQKYGIRTNIVSVRRRNEKVLSDVGLNDKNPLTLWKPHLISDLIAEDQYATMITAAQGRVDPNNLNYHLEEANIGVL
ncbi:MAG: hypothetical protein IPL46_24970 [Saprospiraceae bacterium]|nr:hypothetical protein [Saprospiraceae bacterium]